MKFIHKNSLLLAYIILCSVTLIGIILYHNSFELLHVGFIPYLVIAPGILYFSYQQPGRTGNALALGSTIGLFILPLIAIWLDGRSAANILGGLLPYNDPSAYYIDALGLFDNQLLSYISVRRPIFTAFLSFLFMITGRNLQITLVILAILNAVICYMLVRRIQNLWGAAAAVIVTMLVSFFYRRFVGTTLTENLGLALGMAAFGLLLEGAQNSDRKSVFLGIFLLSLGMNVRTGALLILPVIILWASWFFREKTRISMSALFLGVFAVSLGFFINWGTEKLVVDPEISKSKTGMFSNYSYTFYGIAAGGEGWTYVNVDHPELSNVDNRESLVYEYAFQSIRQNPALFLKGVTRSFLDFFSPRNGAFSFLYASTSTPCLMEDFLDSMSSCQNNHIAPNNGTAISCVFSHLSLRIVDILFSLMISLLLLVPMLWGMYISYKKKDQPWGLLVLALMIGVLLSSPLVPPRDASKMRVYAVTQPVLITVAAIGLVDICQSLAKKSKAFTFFKSVETTTLKNNNDKSRNLVLTGVILAAVIFISPIAARLNGKTPEPIKSTCPSHLEEKQFRFNPGSSIELVEGTTASMTWAGIRVPVHRFKSNLEEICVSSEKEIAKMIDLGFLQPGDVLLEPAFLNQDGNLLLLVISSNEIPSNAAYLTICGEEKNGVFYSQFIER